MGSSTPPRQANVILTFPFGPFDQEVLLLFHFARDASGSLKITSVVEYVDSLKVKEFKDKRPGGAPAS